MNMMEIFESDLDSGYMAKYIALNRAMQLLYQHLHWITKGTAFYGDHLLFERLYKKLTLEIDQVAEKAIGLTDESAACPVSTTGLAHKLLSALLIDFNTSGDASYFVESALFCENAFLNQNDSFYQTLAARDHLTLRLDDIIMSIHSSHEENVYLLKQRYNVLGRYYICDFSDLNTVKKATEELIKDALVKLR